MKILTPTCKLATLSLMVAIFMSSCSNKMASLSNSTKLEHAQAIEKNKTAAPTNTLAETPTTPAEVKTPVEVKTLVANTPEAAVTKKEKTNAGAKIKHFTQNLAQTIHTESGKIVAKQTAAISHMADNHHTASVSGASHTQSLLGFALVCLIVAIILAALGFGGLGSVFWAIGIVVLVVALIIFLLYLLGEAASA